MVYNLSTEDYRLENALNLANNIANSNDYYFFVGDYLPHVNSALQPIFDNTNNTVTEVWRNMIQGLQLQGNSVYSVINNIQWTANTVYTRYDDQANNLAQEEFFAITNEGSWYHIWKCLDNNFGAASTVQPLFAYVSPESHFIQLTDGYAWKYMTSVSASIANNFLTSNYFPVVANTTVQENAIPGAIDIFALESNGAFYNNFVSGSFASRDIAVNGNPVLFNIANSVASDVFDYYSNCMIYLSAGTGEGQFANIVAYVSNTTGNIIEIDHPFAIIPQNGTAYQIAPQISITADGNQTVNCFAICQINSLASNSVSGVTVIQSGAGYQYIASSNVVANSVVGVSNNALVRAILPPQGGHGSNVFSELYSNSIGIYVTLQGTASGNLLANNDYQQIGLMYNPLFANVGMNISSYNGNFFPDEQIFGYLSTQIDVGVVTTNASANLTCNTANFMTQVQEGEYLIVGNQSNTITQLIQVANVVNSSTITAQTSMVFSCTAAFLYSLDILGSAYVTRGGSNNITVTNCSPILSGGVNIIGVTSGTIGYISGITRANTAANFNFFNNLIKVSAILQSGTFIPDETIQQGTNASASVFAVAGVSNTITIYCNELLNGPIQVGQQFIGANSGAIANVQTVYPPDLIAQSGQILYIENINPITRSNTQTEAFLIVLNF